jgi:hypothetical protein
MAGCPNISCLEVIANVILTSNTNINYFVTHICDNFLYSYKTSILIANIYLFINAKCITVI